MTEGELLWLAETAAASGRVVEIGSWRGRSAVALTSTPGTLWVVDHWKGSGRDPNDLPTQTLATEGRHRIVKDFVRHLAPDIMSRKVTVLEEASLTAARYLATLLGERALDLVFIDADHKYESVISDILAWLPHLRTGGILAGHDYRPDANPEVVEAVNDLLPDRHLHEAIWWRKIE